MSRPEWDRESREVWWEGKRFSCVSVNGFGPSEPESFIASLPMENGCTLDLVCPEDDCPYVTLELSPIGMDEEMKKAWLNGLFALNIENGEIVVRAMLQGETPADRILSPNWYCEVDEPSQVFDFQRRWGALPVRRV
jgi:hypothetical protein